MKMRKLGGQGLEVSEIGLGCMNLSLGAGKIIKMDAEPDRAAAQAANRSEEGKA